MAKEPENMPKHYRIARRIGFAFNAIFIAFGITYALEQGANIIKNGFAGSTPKYFSEIFHDTTTYKKIDFENLSDHVETPIEIEGVPLPSGNAGEFMIYDGEDLGTLLQVESSLRWSRRDSSLFFNGEAEIAQDSVYSMITRNKGEKIKIYGVLLPTDLYRGLTGDIKFDNFEIKADYISIKKDMQEIKLRNYGVNYNHMRK